MAKRRVYEIAKETGLTSTEVIEKLEAAGLKVSGSLAGVDEKDVKKVFSDGGSHQTAAKKKASGTAGDNPRATPTKEKKERPAAKESKAPAAKESKAPAAKSEPKPAGKTASKSGTKAAAEATKSPKNSESGKQAASSSGKQAPAAAAKEAQAPAGKKASIGAGKQRQAPAASGKQRQAASAGRPGDKAAGASKADATTPAPGSGAHGKRRRVIIDPSAAKRRSFVPSGRHQRVRHKGSKRDAALVAEQPEVAVKEAVPGAPAKVNSGATVKDLSAALGISTAEIIKLLMSYGEMATITQSLSDEAITTLADDLERKVEIVHVQEEEEAKIEDLPEDLKPRAPVVTIMGHVDHGKTSLLDAIRVTEVAAGEAGGITQHIGAYQVESGKKRITFLDTPGHEAFTAMRARGAKVTDIAVLVVAADDGVMPQTIEAIDHSKAAGVPIVVAVNKIDKPEANPDRVRQELSEHGLIPEDWGGETIFVDVSAKQKIGLDSLLEMILLVAEVQELKANPDTMASGVVIESKLDPGRGVVATVLINRGTMRVGDAIVAGQASGKVKAMNDFKGRPLKAAGPSVPVEILGFDSIPQAGESCRIVEDEKKARVLATRRSDRLKAELLAKRRAFTLDDVFAKIKEGEVKDLNLVIKADVAGSVEALEDALKQIKHVEVKINIIHTGVGGINESDVMLAAASQAIVIGFNVRPSAAAKTVANIEGVDVRTYSVIYKVTEDVQKALIGMLAPTYVEEEMGEAEIRQTFKASRLGTIAGCYVTRGRVTRNAQVRLVRNGTVIYDGKLGSLKRFKEDTREVEEGYECGILLEDYQDVKEGDILEFYETKEVKAGG